jgi:predicted nuclease of predicted toxin-antitoxin system
VRFLCDNDISAVVAGRLRAMGHEAWTAADAGLADVDDDELTVYADDREAVLLTHDRRFSQRRRRHVVGKHVWLQCSEWDAADLLEKRLPEFIDQLERPGDLWVRVHQEGFEVARTWGH